MRGVLSAKVPNSSFAEVRMGLPIEPTHMEDEDEEQENEKEDERDCEECRVEVACQWKASRALLGKAGTW